MRDILSARATAPEPSNESSGAAPNEDEEDEEEVPSAGDPGVAESWSIARLRMTAAGLALAVQQCSFVDSDLRKGCDEELQLLRLGFFLVQCVGRQAVPNGIILQQHHEQLQ